jgi:hypothetical protein
MLKGLHSFVAMVRHLFALASVVLLSGFLPLSANMGFCAANPCCRSHSAANGVSIVSHPACCNKTNCAPASGDTEATHAKASASPLLVAIAPTLVCNAPLPVRLIAAEPFVDGSPPTSRRLAALSILLV